jgi:hypothetical protein
MPFFNEDCRPMDRAVVDPVHGTVDLFHEFFNSKIIIKIPKNPRMLHFYKNTTKLSQNCILVLEILHIGP